MNKYKELDKNSRQLLKSSSLPQKIKDMVAEVYPYFVRRYDIKEANLGKVVPCYDEELLKKAYIPGGHKPEIKLTGRTNESVYILSYGRYPHNDMVFRLEEVRHGRSMYGYVDSFMKPVIQCEYDEIGLFDSDGRCFARKNGNYFLVGKEEETVNPYGYNGVGIAKSFLVFECDGLCGLIDTQGVVTLEAEWEEINVVQLDEHRLYDETHSFTSYPIYFLQNWIEAKNERGSFLVNDKGEIVSTEPYDKIIPFTTWMSYAEFRFYTCSLLITERELNLDTTHGGITTTRNGLVDVVDKAELLPASYYISQYGRCVFVVHNGEACSLYSPLKRRFLFDFSEKWEAIKMDDIEAVYGDSDGLDFLEEYLFPAMRGGKWGYMNIYGVEKIKCIFDAADFFSHGTARVYIFESVKYGGLSGFLIDRHGNIVNDN